MTEETLIPPIPFLIKKQLHRPRWNLFKMFFALLCLDKDMEIINFLKYVSKARIVRLTDSGTSAIRLVLQKIKRKNPDRKEVVLPSYCCKCVADAVISEGLIPHFVDVDDNFMVCARTIKPAVSDDTLAIIAPHMYGECLDVESIVEAFPHIPVIEDKAMRIQDKLVGDYGILSFNIGKQLQSMGGGALLIK